MTLCDFINRVTHKTSFYAVDYFITAQNTHETNNAALILSSLNMHEPITEIFVEAFQPKVVVIVIPFHSELKHISEKNIRELLTSEGYAYMWNIVTTNTLSSCTFNIAMLLFIIKDGYHNLDVYDCA